jgi:hypothetical protein
MKFNEVMPQQGFEHPEENKLETAKKTDTRRPRLTLEHLSKLRKMREIRKLEVEERKELFKRIYARPVAME